MSGPYLMDGACIAYTLENQQKDVANSLLLMQKVIRLVGKVECHNP